MLWEGSGAPRTEIVLPPLLKGWGERERPDRNVDVASALGWDSAVAVKVTCMVWQASFLLQALSF